MARNPLLISNSYALFLCFFLSVFLPAAFSQNNATDVEALLAFKAAIVSDPLGALTSWNKTVHFCSWSGVICSRRHRDRVVSINLISQGLVGSLSPHVGNLSFLRRITLQNNSFSGPIPGEIGRLRRLVYVKLSNNSFGGEIPRNLSQCKNLYYLNLIDNNLTGTIMPEIGALVRLQALGLASNRLSGTIPSSIGNLTFLYELSLADCGLKGQIPNSFSQLKNLRFLYLSENSLTGCIPSGLFNSSIIEFVVRYNQLQGTIPPDVGYTLPNIIYLDLVRNNLSGRIPASLSNASSLEHFELASNNFTGPLLINFEKLPNLQYVILENNSIHGDVSFISTLTNCTRLKTLSINRNLLNGTLPNSIANLSRKLTFLSMAQNNIHGKVPSGIGDLNLAFLMLHENDFSGSIPPSIGNLVKLQALTLGSNKITGEIPPSLGNLTLLNHLFLGQNYISGSIPQSFRNFRNLLTFDLSLNNLNGAMPPEIFSISVSILFDLAYNEFTGPIPHEVGGLRNLGILDLSNNRLSGSIPSAISSCVSLESLNLEGNALQGEIPIGMSALRGLQELDLSRNHLSGSIPSFLGELRLLNLNLSFNELQGPVPTSGVFQNKSAIFFDGNTGLCGDIPELGLQPCPTLTPPKRNVSKVWKVMVPIGVVGVMFSVIIVLLIVFSYNRRTKERSMTSVPSFNENFTRLSYTDLVKATDRFSGDNFIGAGRFGSVYRGTLDNGKTMIAVKVLNLNIRGASKTFIAECNALGGIRHRNLIKILSVCLSIDFQGQDFKALVYEYKSNGSLEEWLHHNGGERINLTVIQRLNIVIDIASALEYLHVGTNSIIIHGDLKPSNILLDHDMTGYVGDFGLAKVISNISRDVPITESSSVGVKGTIGYIAPEYGMGDMVSVQGDAYSFGILLLEMFTNIKPTNEVFKDHSNLHNFVATAIPDSVMGILDPFVVQEIEVNDAKAEQNKECMMSILRIGVACTNEFPRDRLAMADVVIELNKIRKAYVA